MAGVLQHLRSSTLDKRPNPASMVDGQVAINYASGSPGMFFKDSNGDLVKVGPVHVGTTAPNVSPASGGTAGNSKGEQWLDTSGGTYVFKIWDGAAWRSEAGEFVNTTGDTMTGALGIIAGSASTPGLFFSGDTNTGVYAPSADQLAITTGGTARLTATTSAITSALPVDVPLGGASAPSLTFTGDTNTGIYSPGANQLALSTNGTGRLFVDASGNVGVGASTPNNYADYKTLTLNGLSGAEIDLEVNDILSGSFWASANGTRLQSGAGLPIIFNTGTNERLRITSAGLVGIGTNDPKGIVTTKPSAAFSTATNTFNGSGLHIDGTNSATGDNTYGSAITWSRNGNANTKNAAIVHVQTGSDVDFGGLAFLTHQSSSSGDPLVEAVRIDSSGRVGIGTLSPSDTSNFGNALDVNGATGSAVYVRTNGSVTNFGLIGHYGTDFYISNNANGPTRFFTNGGERARIDSSGRLLVGTVSGSYQLQLSTDSAGKPSTNTWTIVSDERIKEEIELADLDLCYEAVKNIPLKRFKWKDEVYTEEQAYDRRKLGWIAQDVEAVFPKAVRQHEFKYNQVFEEVIIPAVPAELDDDGNVITEEQPERIEKGELISEEVIEDCRDLNSDQLYAAMYGAIQKLISKVELLEAEVQALKAA